VRTESIIHQQQVSPLHATPLPPSPKRLCTSLLSPPPASARMGMARHLETTLERVTHLPVNSPCYARGAKHAVHIGSPHMSLQGGSSRAACAGLAICPNISPATLLSPIQWIEGQRCKAGLPAAWFGAPHGRGSSVILRSSGHALLPSCSCAAAAATIIYKRVVYTAAAPAAPYRPAQGMPRNMAVQSAVAVSATLGPYRPKPQ
jgi:hypothetical protein